MAYVQITPEKKKLDLAHLFFRYCFYSFHGSSFMKNHPYILHTCIWAHKCSLFPWRQAFTKEAEDLTTIKEGEFMLLALDLI